MSETTPIHALVSNVIGGSLLVQHARALDIDTTCLEDPNSPETLELYRSLTVNLGLDFELASTHVLGSLSALMTDDEVANYNVNQLATTLWKVLGDPAQNGDTPPPLYTEAGKAVYAFFLVLLYPTKITI
jgi:hypothetical protein